MKKTVLRSLLPLLIFLGIWMLALIAFWCMGDPSDVGGYSLLFFWLIVPAAILITSFFVGLDGAFGHARWMLPLCYGALFLLLEYVTFELSNIVANGGVSPWNTPAWSLLLVGTGLSLTGIGFGTLLRVLRARKAA